jgi:hypothetical protein
MGMNSGRLDQTAAARLGRGTLRKGALSAIAVIWIALQLYAGLRVKEGGWPFTGYPMYSSSHHVGDATKIVRLKGLTVLGKPVAITADDFGLSFHGLRRRLDKRILARKQQPQDLEAYAAGLLAIYNQTRTNPQERLSRLEILYEGRILGSRGSSEPYSKTIFTYDVNSIYGVIE